MKKADTPEPENLWKNQRLIDEHGLVICQDRERLFDNLQAATLFESLLKIYQEKGLGIHYLFMGFDGEDRKLRNYQTVRYRAYTRFRCIKKEFDGGRKVIAEFHVQYEIIRIDPSLVGSRFRFPFLLLFRPASGERECEQCGELHFCKVFQSSLYVIRSQFISMVRSKIFFMERYPAYSFQPFDFMEKRNSGDVIYEFIRDHNYEPSYYFEKSEEIVCNTVRMQTLVRDMDFQTVRFDHFKEMGFSEKDVQFCQQHFERNRSTFKLKYMCRKCDPKQIWTTKNQCIMKTAVIKMKELPVGGEKVVYDHSGDIKDDLQIKYKAEKPINYGQSLLDLFQIKHIKIFNRRFDRSLKKQVQDFQDYGQKLNSISRWHQTLAEYKYPFLVVVSLEIPKMKCQVCQKEKEGLIYITNLLEELHSFLVSRIVDRVERAREGKEGKQKQVKEGKQSKQAKEM